MSQSNLNSLTRLKALFVLCYLQWSSHIHLTCRCFFVGIWSPISSLNLVSSINLTTWTHCLFKIIKQTVHQTFTNACFFPSLGTFPQTVWPVHKLKDFFHWTSHFNFHVTHTNLTLIAPLVCIHRKGSQLHNHNSLWCLMIFTGEANRGKGVSAIVGVFYGVLFVSIIASQFVFNNHLTYDDHFHFIFSQLHCCETSHIRKLWVFILISHLLNPLIPFPEYHSEASFCLKGRPNYSIICEKKGRQQ